MSTSTTFGALLRRLRSAMALSQETLAERSGLSRSGISHLERGLHPAPRLETVRLLADALALTEADRAALLAAARPALFPPHGPDLPLAERAALPTPLRSLIGREMELTAVRSALLANEVRVLTLTGPGGVGKTRLAVGVATDIAGGFLDGVAFVDLSPLTDPDLVIPTIAATLGAQETVGRRPQETLVDVLAPRELLLVLDNCERVLEAASAVAEVVAACPGITILATSREALHIDGEQLFPLGPLPLPATPLPALPALMRVPSIALFVARAMAVKPGFALTATNAAAIAAICQRVDGLPLAIELAAARVRHLPPEGLLSRLEPRLPLLTGGPRNQPARLQTMRAAIAWSYDLLSEPEAELFRSLAIFVGGFTLEAAAGVMATSESTPSLTLEMLTELVDKSLLQLMHDSGPDPRFTMLDTVREFALEQLTISGALDVMATRHSTWYGCMAEEVRRTGGWSQGRSLLALEAEHANMRAALDWLLERGETTAALHLAGQLSGLWFRRGHWAEATTWLTRALAADCGPPTAARAEALVALSMLYWPRDEFDRARHLLREAEAVAREAGDAGATAYARIHQGFVAVIQGDLDLAVARGEECLTTCAAIDQEFSCNGALWLLARATLERGEDERSAQLHRRLLEAGQKDHDEISIANGHYGLAILAERRGEGLSALAGFAAAANTCQGFGDVLFASLCLDAVAAVAVTFALPESATRLFAAASALRAAIGAAAAPRLQADRHRHLRRLEVAKSALDPDRFAAAWAAGSLLALDEAVAEAEHLARLVATHASLPNNEAMCEGGHDLPGIFALTAAPSPCSGA